MASAIHFINRPDDRGNLLNLSRLQGASYRTCCWAISADDAASLVGGWLYLHEAKDDPSRFGGEVTAIEPVTSPEYAREKRFAFVFTARPQARGRRWRGASHPMAWTSGIVEADAQHEMGG